VVISSDRFPLFYVTPGSSPIVYFLFKLASLKVRSPVATHHSSKLLGFGTRLLPFPFFFRCFDSFSSLILRFYVEMDFFVLVRFRFAYCPPPGDDS